MTGALKAAGIAIVVLAGSAGLARADLTISNRTTAELLIEIYNNADGSMLVTCRTMAIGANQSWSVSPGNSTNCLTYQTLKLRASGQSGTSMAHANPCMALNLDWKGSAGVSIEAPLDGSSLTCNTY